MKFKDGDRVVAIRDSDYEYLELIGEVGIIENDGTDIPYVHFDCLKGRPDKKRAWYEYDLVLEEVFNSPLYQALRED